MAAGERLRSNTWFAGLDKTASCVAPQRQLRLPDHEFYRKLIIGICSMCEKSQTTSGVELIHILRVRPSIGDCVAFECTPGSGSV